MKTWFKYEYGYVNLDSDTLYLTNSGNWSETTTLSEKTKEITQKNDTKNYKYVSFLVSIIAFFCVLFFNTILSGKVSLTLFF
jgi:methionyl-tRNA synthetase